MNCKTGKTLPKKTPNLVIKIMHWKAGGFSQDRNVEIHKTINQQVDCFIVTEANITEKYYRMVIILIFLYKSRQVASAIMVGTHF